MPSVDLPPLPVPGEGRGEGGFTLVEVLVALAIVAFGLAALFTTVNQTVRTSTYLREKTLAQWIALNRISEVRLQGQKPAGQKTAGELQYAGQTWRWEFETIQTPVAGIVRLESRVAAQSAPKETWTGQATGFMGDAISPNPAGFTMSKSTPAPPPAGGSP